MKTTLIIPRGLRSVASAILICLAASRVEAAPKLYVKDIKFEYNGDELGADANVRISRTTDVLTFKVLLGVLQDGASEPTPLALDDSVVVSGSPVLKFRLFASNTSSMVDGSGDHAANLSGSPQYETSGSGQWAVLRFLYSPTADEVSSGIIGFVPNFTGANDYINLSGGSVATESDGYSLSNSKTDQGFVRDFVNGSNGTFTTYSRNVGVEVNTYAGVVELEEAVEQDGLTVEVGKTKSFTVSRTVSSFDMSGLAASSSDSGKVTVSRGGATDSQVSFVVTGVADGTASVIVKDGTHTIRTVPVNVVDLAARAVSFKNAANPASITFLPPILNEGDSTVIAVNLGSQVPSDRTFSVSVADPNIASVSQSSIEVHSGFMQFAFAVTAVDGPGSTVVTVRDEAGFYATSTFTVTVHDVAPEFRIPVGGEGTKTGRVNVPVDFIVDVSDKGSRDTISLSWDFGAGDPPIESPLAAQPVHQSKSYTWTDKGSYTVTIIATDKDGSSSMASYTVDIHPITEDTEVPDGLYTAEQMHELALGDSVIELDPTSGMFDVGVRLQSRASLTDGDWETVEITSDRVSVDNEGRVRIKVVPNENAAFFRFVNAED